MVCCSGNSLLAHVCSSLSNMSFFSSLNLVGAFHIFHTPEWGGVARKFAHVAQITLYKGTLTCKIYLPLKAQDQWSSLNGGIVLSCSVLSLLRTWGHHFILTIILSLSNKHNPPGFRLVLPSSSISIGNWKNNVAESYFSRLDCQRNPCVSLTS